MILNWMYFADSNSSSCGEVEMLLNKKHAKLNSFHQLDDLLLNLENNNHTVLFLNTSTVYNVYDLCQSLSIKYPYVYIILMVTPNMENIKKGMNAGASDLLGLGDELEETRDCINRAEKYMREREDEKNSANFKIPRNSRVISVCSPKGGIGRTVTAVNLATAFSKQGKKVAIMDANLQFGDVAMYYDCKPKVSIYEWIKEGFERNQDSIEKYLVQHSSGVSILAAPQRPEFFEMIKEEHVKEAINELKKRFDFVLIDTPANLSEIHLRCLQESDELLLLVTSDLPVLRSSRLFIETIETFQLSKKVKLILTRDAKNKKIEGKKIENIMELPIIECIPNHESLVSSSVNQGIPFVLSRSRTPISKAIFSLSKQLLKPPLDQMMGPRGQKSVGF